MDVSHKVKDLSDSALSRALILITRHRLYQDLSLNPWERGFIVDVPGWWVREGELTWKQRRIAKRILTDIAAELERRKEHGDWIEEAARGEEPVSDQPGG